MRVLIGRIGSKLPKNVAEMLRHGGLAIDQVDETTDVVGLARKQDHDLLIFTVNPPDKGHTELFRSLRRQGCSTPILSISAGDALFRIDALNAGADDCVSTSISDEELLARVRALLRRPPLTVGPTYTVRDLSLNSSTASVTCDGERILMPRREVALLELLMRSGAAPVTRERLEQALFSFDDAVTPNALEAAISRLRRRLKSAGSIVTIVSTRGFGYSLEIGAEFRMNGNTPKALEVGSQEAILAAALVADT